MKDDILVTVQCLAYNQEKYIRQTLEGFVMQRTDFKFEVIVHDDASTDNTPKIIKEFAEKYDYIRPIFQTENQYSKHIAIGKEYIHPIARGKYIAYCEGDDYWTDPHKLQKQVDYMESHPECSMCCHSYNLISEDGTKTITTVNTLPESGIISPKLAIEYKNPSQIATQMYRAEVVIGRPECFYGYGVGDYPLLLYSVTKGTLYYNKHVMANKREASNGSWTSRIYKNPEAQLQHWSKMRTFLAMFNDYTDHKYADAIEMRLNSIEFTESLLKGNYRKAIRNSLFGAVTAKRKVQIVIGCVSPTFAKKIEKIFS